jgi:hypothetical protein
MGITINVSCNKKSLTIFIFVTFHSVQNHFLTSSRLKEAYSILYLILSEIVDFCYFQYFGALYKKTVPPIFGSGLNDRTFNVYTANYLKNNPVETSESVLLLLSRFQKIIT